MTPGLCIVLTYQQRCLEEWTEVREGNTSVVEVEMAEDAKHERNFHEYRWGHDNRL